MLKAMGLIIVGIVAWFFIDDALEYRYWKNEKQQGVFYIKNVIDDVKNHNKNALEDEFKRLQSLFENGNKFTPNHENIEKLARMYILNDILAPQSQNYYEFRTRYIKAGAGLRPGCHYDYLILLYQKELGLRQLKPSGFCNGWDELDKEIVYLEHTPHARSELRY